ncbi:helix-turn-helix transcriptional regulator [Burkholderia cenocepacia]|uniref:helix-turn-helix transcriptional regulator n=1 Tax=Burkholderia cenocepacia TaxID=95486 RepID=UPI000A6A2781
MQRVERAKEWMRDPNMPLSMIAVACGFADQSHFSRTFTRLTGVTPRRWRADHT